MSVEQQLHEVKNGGAKSTPDADEDESDVESAAVPGRASPGPTWNDGDSGRQTFVGEISMPALEASSNELGHASSVKSATSNPVLDTDDQNTGRTARVGAKKQSRGRLRKTASSHGIVPEDLDCERLLKVCFDEVHILYPFLHPPSVHQTCKYLSSKSFMVSQSELEERQESNLTVAIVFICLALGQCTASSRITDAEPHHSAGWSLYSVAMDLIRPQLDIVSDAPICLQSLQILILMASLHSRTHLTPS